MHERAAGRFQRVNLQQARALFEREVRDPFELMQVVLGQGENESEGNAGGAQLRQSLDEALEGIGGSADLVVGGRQAIDTDG